MEKLGLKTSVVLGALRIASENESYDGADWRDVYLDNARPPGIPPTAFRSCLAKLSRVGLYRPVGVAWGSVRMTNKERE